MKKNGFTLIEFLVCLAMLGIVLVIGLAASHNMLTTSLAGLRVVSDDEVFKAAKNYVNEKNISFNDNGYVCVSVNDLIDNGYLVDTNNYELKNKLVKLKKNSVTKVISRMWYVDSCS